MQHLFPFLFFFFLKQQCFTNILADNLHVFSCSSGNMSNPVESFYSYLGFTVLCCGFIELFTQCEGEGDALKALFVLKVITCLSALIVMLSLAILAGFLEDKSIPKRKQKERKKPFVSVICTRNLRKPLGSWMSCKEKSGTDRKCKYFTACSLEKLLAPAVFNFLLKTGCDVSSFKFSDSYLLSRKDIFCDCQVTAVFYNRLQMLCKTLYTPVGPAHRPCTCEQNALHKVRVKACMYYTTFTTWIIAKGNSAFHFSAFLVG